MLRVLKLLLDRIGIHRLVVHDDDLNQTVLRAREKMALWLVIAFGILLRPPFSSNLNLSSLLG